MSSENPIKKKGCMVQVKICLKMPFLETLKVWGQEWQKLKWMRDQAKYSAFLQPTKLDDELVVHFEQDQNTERLTSYSTFLRTIIQSQRP